MTPEKITTEQQSFLQDLFGNPPDGTLLAWLADKGLFAILIVLGALFIWLMARFYFKKLFGGKFKKNDTHLTKENNLRTWGFSFQNILSFILFVFIASGAFISITFLFGGNVQLFWINIERLGQPLLRWISTSGIRIIFFVVIGWLVIHVSRRLVPSLMMKFIRDGRDAADRATASRKRAETLSTVMLGAINIVVFISIVFTILTELGAPVGPVLGGVGIVGIAIGFGAQHLVKDFITGVLILMENQYRQGDVVHIAGISGLVESVNLRRTVLRDLEGKVHTIPHGEVSTTTNFTKYWSRILLDVGVAYKEDMDHVFRILNEVGEELANHPEHGLKVIDPPKVLRLNSFDDSAITIRVLGVCKPLSQWELAGWMRKRIKERFDQEGIEIPFPHTSVYWGADQPALPWDRIKPEIKTSNQDEPRKSEQSHPSSPTAIADDFIDPTLLTATQREEMLSEMALAAKAAQDLMLREQNGETRLPSDGK